MGDWAHLTQSVILGLIFSYLLAKLISIVVSFTDDNLSHTRHGQEPKSEVVDPRRIDSSSGLVRGGEADSVLAEQGSSRGGDSVAGDTDEEDDDWEGVESTELDESFSAATAFVAKAAADKASSPKKVPSDVQQRLYGLYKIATEGPCTSPQPSALKITARAKWQAWRKLGAMPPEEAMEKYIEIVTQLYPTWLDGAVVANSLESPLFFHSMDSLCDLLFQQKSKRRGMDDAASNSRGTIGPVFSSLVYEEETANELKIDAIHAFAREGDIDNLLKTIESGISVNARDSEGRTPLHWAIDRGHLEIAKVLVDKNADVNAKDNEGQTPLHYAVVCDREAIAEFLVKQKANTASKDEEGNSPFDLCESEWSWIRDCAKSD